MKNIHYLFHEIENTAYKRIYLSNENYKIIEIAKKSGSLPKNATQNQEDRVLENYWNFMASKTFQLFNKYGVK